MFILVFETNNATYINKMNYYFKEYEIKILSSNNLKKKINNNLILFKKEYYPKTGFNLNTLNKNKVTYLSEDGNIIYVPYQNYDIINNSIEINTESIDKLILFDDLPYSIYHHEESKEFNIELVDLYKVYSYNYSEFYSDNFSMQAVDNLISTLNIKNKFILFVLNINSINYLEQSIYLSEDFLKKYKQLRFIVILDDNSIFNDSFLPIIKVLQKKYRINIIYKINKIFAEILKIGYKYEHIVFIREDFFDFKQYNKNVTKYNMIFDKNYISLPLNIFITIPFLNSKLINIKTMDKFYNYIYNYINVHYKDKYYIDNIRFKKIKNNVDSKLKYHYNTLESYYMVIKDYNSVLTLLNNEMAKTYELDKFNKLIVKKISISVLTNNTDTIEENILNIFTYLDNLLLIDECLLLLSTTKLTNIKKKLHLKQFLEIDNLYKNTYLKNIDEKTMNEEYLLAHKNIKDHIQVTVFSKLFIFKFTEEEIIKIIDMIINTDFLKLLLFNSEVQRNKVCINILKISSEFITNNTIQEKITILFNKLINIDKFTTDKQCLSNENSSEKTSSNNIKQLLNINLEPIHLKWLYNNFIISNAVKFSTTYNTYEEFMINRERIKKNLEEIIESINITVPLNDISIFYNSNFSLSYQGVPSRDIFMLKCKLLRKICPEINYKIDTNYKNNKIKILFHCQMFTRQHSVYKDRHQVIKALSYDNRFDVYFSTFDKMDIQVKFSMGKAKHIILPTKLNEIKDILTKEKFDIIVYAEIGMHNISYMMAMLKLAKIQCNTWGHSDTSGIDTIDYFFSSKLYELPYEEAQKSYSEKLILQSSLCTCYVNPTSRHNISLFKSREFYGFTNDSVLFFCAQSLFKLNPIYDDYIVQILKNVKNSLLILTDSKEKENILKRFNNLNIGHHFRFMQPQEHFGYLNLMSICDIFLDVYPFGGCNSTLEAFSLNKVVVTQPGRMINGRFSSGFYKKMGLEEYICNTKEEYIDMAIKCADIEYRKPIEEKIKNIKDTLFMDKETLEEWKNDLLEIYNNFAEQQFAEQY
jgi:predicted O-linked N-acetylglucosamine transferase (SPINDLY family)